MKDLRTIVMAAGKGTRMKSDIPKVLHEASAKPIIQYVLDVAQSVGSLKTYVVVGHKAEEVKAALPSTAVAVIQKQLKGTADAIRSAASHFRAYRGDVLILCGDTPLLKKQTLKRLIARHRKSKAACTVLTAVVANPQGYGRIIRDKQGKPCAIREEKDALGEEKKISEINVGVYCFKSNDLFGNLNRIGLNAKKREFYLTDIVEMFSRQGLGVEVMITEDASEGLGINSREDLAEAEFKIRQNVLKNFMKAGVTIVDPATTYIDADVKIGKDTTIKPFTFIEKDVRIGDGCIIGPFARLRSGSVIGHKAQVGNFTEVSRTKMGEGVLMKHCSFLGDAVVGSGVNIGAGTITANFDGYKKHRTTIGSGAFIGSDSVLIAPLKIGKKSVIGAGSVVTRETKIPDGSVAFGSPAKVKINRKKRS